MTNATEYKKTANGYDLAYMSTGVCVGCTVCAEEFGHEVNSANFQAEWQSGSLIDEPSFSWQSCELCGSDLGGDRYRAHGRDRNDDIIHLEICTDCLQAMG